MKTTLSKRFASLALTAAAGMWGASRASADVTIDAGAPPNGDGGLMIVWVRDGNGWHIIPVDVKPQPGDANSRLQNKRSNIQDALSNAGYNVSVTSGGVINVGGCTGVQLGQNTTGEVDRCAVLGNVNALVDAETGKIRWEGQIVPVGLDGAESTYTAGFGFNGSQYEVSFPLSSASSQSIDGIVTTAYTSLLAALPSQYQANLSMDLNQDSIFFNYPSGATDPSVTGGNTSGQSWANAGMVPEPGATTVAMIGAGILLVRRRRGE